MGQVYLFVPGNTFPDSAQNPENELQICPSPSASAAVIVESSCGEGDRQNADRNAAYPGQDRLSTRSPTEPCPHSFFQARPWPFLFLPAANRLAVCRILRRSENLFRSTSEFPARTPWLPAPRMPS